ncbi:uncharacterized protein LOC111678137 [Lucilia cuprina]|uniref:uncharacterized protein LOC111678137 n=1 Tax=Lucilia cuprina TaxID=7375 RepID=UPI001F06E7AC|nr:uncharacterized protein LOC111678137 [Lucilia cuprina]
MCTFNDHLQEIHNKISIKDDDRRPYTEMYDNVRNWLMKEMCNADPVFKEIYKGTTLFGSYLNRVRIVTPSEFDVFILLDLPFDFNVTTHPERPGFVQISSDKWKCYDTSSKNKKKFRGMFRQHTIKGLNRNKLQRWIMGIIEHVLSHAPMPAGYNIKHTRCLVAQNIYVQEKQWPYKTISIDFVPAIIMPEEYMKPLVRKRVCVKPKYYKTFLAIPKPLMGCGPKGSRRLTFQLVNPTAECDIIWNKQNLKVVYRLLKSLRNQYGLNRLKSYFLTAVFLQQVNKCTDKFWQQSIGDIFIFILDKLIVYFDQANMPYYWVSGFNLLSILKPEEITEYADILTEVYNDLYKLAGENYVTYSQVLKHFKTTLK